MNQQSEGTGIVPNKETGQFSRRMLLASLAAAAGATALSGCSPRQLPEAGGAGGGDLTVGIPGGSLATWAREIIAEFEQETKSKVAVEEGVSTTFITKLQAGRGTTPFSLITVDENFIFSATEQGLLQRLPDTIENLGDVFDKAIIDDRHGVGIALSRGTLYYNEERIEQGIALNAYDDLFGAEIAPRVAIPHLSLGVGVEFLVGLTAAVTGQSFADAQADLTPGIAALADHGERFRTIYSGINEILPQLGSGEMWATYGKSRQVNDVIRAGAPVVPADIPEAFGGFNCLAIPDGAPNPDAAARLIDRLLSAQSQEKLVEIAGAGPVNTTVSVPDSAAGDIPTHEDVPNLTFLDWATINPQLPELLNTFNQEVVS